MISSAAQNKKIAQSVSQGKIPLLHSLDLRKSFMRKGVWKWLNYSSKPIKWLRNEYVASLLRNEINEKSFTEILIEQKKTRLLNVTFGCFRNP